MQRIGNEVREREGADVWARLTLEKIKAARATEAVVDGFRNPGEVVYFQKQTRFYLVAVDAPEEVRFRRLLGRRRLGDPDTLADFLRLDARDRGVGEPEGGQQVGECLKLAQFTIVNDGSMEKLREKLHTLLLEIQSRQS